MKTVEALKAAAIILILLFLCIGALWIFSQLRQPEQPQPDLTPRPAKTMWEDPPNTR